MYHQIYPLGLCYSGMLRSFGWQLFADVSAQPVGPIIAMTALSLKMRPIGFPDISVTTNKHGVTSQKNEELIYIAVEP
jgi:hypothetical protein